ncbi:MAG TPA: TetR/AcrR family transcriptional regulator [Actinomycetota bacterium]|nr:TetR/AcrR family transcriptional regulator [Actinomycetota bacterium]
MAMRTVDEEGAGRSLDKREHILEAAEQILKEHGLAACTTRAIAELAGCAEGSIYRYFEDKHALFIEVVKRRFPVYLELMASLPELAGTGDVRAHLEEVAKASLVFYRAILPMVAGALADRDLLAHQRTHFHNTGTGPMKIIGSVAEFVRLEQQKGRLSKRASADHVARILLGGCYFQAYLEFFLGDEAAFGPDEGFAEQTVDALMMGLQPARTRKEGSR